LGFRYFLFVGLSVALHFGSSMPHCHSAVARADRRSRALSRGYVVQRTPLFSHIEVPILIAPRIRSMARFLCLHEKHDELAGTCSHFARHATLSASDKLTVAQRQCAFATHREANRAKHAWSPKNAAIDDRRPTSRRVGNESRDRIDWADIDDDDDSTLDGDEHELRTAALTEDDTGSPEKLFVSDPWAAAAALVGHESKDRADWADIDIVDSTLDDDYDPWACPPPAADVFGLADEVYANDPWAAAAALSVAVGGVSSAPLHRAVLHELPLGRDALTPHKGSSYDLL